MTYQPAILIVGGDEALNMSVKAHLESCGGEYAVDCVKDASGCLNYLREKKPDLILLDTELPDADGFAIRARLKATDAKDVPVIYLAGKPGYDMARKTAMLAADDFIVKPVNPPELILRIQKILAYRCYRKKRRGGRARTGIEGAGKEPEANHSRSKPCSSKCPVSPRGGPQWSAS